MKPGQPDLAAGSELSGWGVVLVVALILSGILAFGYRLYRMRKGGPMPDAVGGAVLAAGLFAVALAFIVRHADRPVAAQDTSKDTATQPVEDDMHEFMEYVFQPAFNRLKPQMASAPANPSSNRMHRRRSRATRTATAPSATTCRPTCVKSSTT